MTNEKKFEKVLRCPRCDDDYNHFNGEPFRGFEGKTGDWKIPVKCETGDHTYTIVFSEHKGNIFVWVEIPVPEVEVEYLKVV